MKQLRIAINGFGRIGRLICRLAQDEPEITLVAINDLIDIDQAAYLLKNDSIHRKFSGLIQKENDQHLRIGQDLVFFGSIKDPAGLPWGSRDVDVVVESTGIFLTQASASVHLKAGAKKVVLSAPPKDDTPTFVMGVNHQSYRGESIVSNASCTTNCLAPMAKILHHRFGIIEGLMSTVHAATASQSVVDSVKGKDWRLGRSSALNIIPTSTGAAKAVGTVCPDLQGKLTGVAFRVPILDGSVVDLTCRLRESTSYETIVEEFKRASAEEMSGILRVANAPMVSSDIIGETHPCIVDPFAGLALNEHFFKLIAWYDNEVGYAHQLLKLVKWISAA